MFFFKKSKKRKIKLTYFRSFIQVQQSENHMIPTSIHVAVCFLIKLLARIVISTIKTRLAYGREMKNVFANNTFTMFQCVLLIDAYKM